MPDAALNLPVIGQPDSTEEPKVRQALADIQAIINDLDIVNLSASAASILGVGSAGRGKSIISTTEARSSSSYGVLTTPDRVTVTLPTDGLIFAAYQATWAESVYDAARVALFLNSTPLKCQATGRGDVAPDIPETALTARTYSGSDPIAGVFRPLVTSDLSGYLPFRTISNSSTNTPTPPVSYPGDVTTGEMGPTPIPIFAAAGTYTVSVQYKASSGDVTVKDRKLWVWTMGF